MQVNMQCDAKCDNKNCKAKANDKSNQEAVFDLSADCKSYKKPSK